MRGAHVQLVADETVKRIIPADAGSTTAFTPIERILEDHPRGCGEHSVLPTSGPTLTGSSPRMRGAQDVGHADVDLLGIIPADAGSTGFRT